jgi:hypothetical protein
MPIVYMSLDDGTLYPESAIDPGSVEHFEKYEIPEVVTLTADQLTYGHGSVIEVLLLAGKAEKQ